MPYVPTNDRPDIDKAVEIVAQEIAATSPKNFDLLRRYKDEFLSIGGSVATLNNGGSFNNAHPLAQACFLKASQYGYDGAILGELNYAITRLIQRVPQIKVAKKEWEETSELRYWLYAITVEALVFTSQRLLNNGFGVGGVFEDIKDEYKIRVNQSYEAAQIIKSGDCYDTPFYSKLLPVVGQTGETIGHVHLLVKRSEGTKSASVLEDRLHATKSVEGLVIHDDGHVTVAIPPATPESLTVLTGVTEVGSGVMTVSVDKIPVKRGRGRPKKVVA